MSLKGFLDHKDEQLELPRQQWPIIWAPSKIELSKLGFNEKQIAVEELRAWRKYLQSLGIVTK